MSRDTRPAELADPDRGPILGDLRPALKLCDAILADMQQTNAQATLLLGGVWGTAAQMGFGFVDAPWAILVQFGLLAFGASCFAIHARRELAYRRLRGPVAGARP